MPLFRLPRNRLPGPAAWTSMSPTFDSLCCRALQLTFQTLELHGQQQSPDSRLQMQEDSLDGCTQYQIPAQMDHASNGLAEHHHTNESAANELSHDCANLLFGFLPRCVLEPDFSSRTLRQCFIRDVIASKSRVQQCYQHHEAVHPPPSHLH